MQRELFVLRHAKSSWNEPDKADKDRPLKPKGIRDIVTLAQKVRRRVENLNLIISSSANRAIHTAILFADEATVPFEKIKIDRKLYEASESDIIKILSELPDSFKSVMIVGHNPTLTYFVNSILPDPVFELPTAGLVCFKFDCTKWSEISKSTLVDYCNEFSVDE